MQSGVLYNMNGRIYGIGVGIGDPLVENRVYGKIRVRSIKKYGKEDNEGHSIP